MTDLTEKWKAGELESLGELVKQIEEVDNRRALSDEYLIERDEASRSEYAPAEEWGYGIAWAMSDYVLPYLKELQAIKEELAEPEKNDVWKSKNGSQIFHIIKVSENAVRCFRKGFILKPETFNKEHFLERCKYLGKSKANINELFEVDDER